MLPRLFSGVCKPLFALILSTGTASAADTTEPVQQTAANVMTEVTFHAVRAHPDPFNQVTLDASVTDPSGHQRLVPAFWAGSNIWKLRYASPIVGTHRFRTQCSDQQDPGLQGITSQIVVESYPGSNPLYAHGPLQVAADRRHLEHLDHTPFFWLADTWWMGLCHRLRWPDEFRQLLADRKEKGFNVIQLVAGLYPDMFPFDPRGANEAGYPWETNYARIRPDYFEAADQRLACLVEQGFTPCIVGAWGYFMPWMGVEKMKAHWRYLIARYGAWPVVWCAAGEANLPWYLAPGFPYDDRKQVGDWTEVMRFIRVTDPFHRLLTVHPTAINRYTARHATDDPALLDFDMLQTPHGRAEAVPVTVKAVRDSYAATPVMPVIDGEASYEMLNDNLPTEWTRRMFWVCLMNGAAGHTYGANGIWQCNRPGQPHGASPHGGSYGKIAWNEAMHLPGSRQVGLAKSFLEQFPWQRFEPHPEWAAFLAEPQVGLEGCPWIWFPEGNPAQNAPAAKRFFRRTFVLPQNRVIAHASLRASADDWFAASLNGHPLGVVEDWPHGKQFDELAGWLKPGTNVLAISAENKPTSGSANPAGLLACLEIRFADGAAVRLVSDEQWHCSRDEAQGWDAAGFDDRAWAEALVVAHYGDGPWGRIGSHDPGLVGPQSAGIPAQVRLIYVPERRAIEVRGLDPQVSYAAARFDPVSGARAPLGLVRARTGLWRCAPGDTANDWVLVLEPAK
jgi:hypothetical protein